MLSNEPSEDAGGGEAVCCGEDATNVLLANTNNLLNNYIKNINIFLIKGEVEKTDLCCVSIGVD